MPNKYNSLIVVLSDDTAEDDAKALIGAILLLRGVCAVTGNAPDRTSFIAESRARHELAGKLWAVLYPEEV